MTVSRVLRNVGKVSPKQRAHVRNVAKRLGYQPDPTVAKLMHHLRNRHKPSFQGSICAITTLRPAGPANNYTAGVLAGAKAQAEARGYAFSTLHTETTRDASRNLQRILHSRGVEGVILLPMAVPGTLHQLLDWEDFSVVAATSSVTAPDFHRVMPHHFKNAQLLCESVERLGYRRIGLVQTIEHVERIYHAFNAAVAWHGIFHHDRLLAPFIYYDKEPVELSQWFEREQPDVVITLNERFCYRFAELLGLSAPRPIGFATTSATPGSGCAGIDQMPEQIGTASVDLLTSLIQRGEKGVPAVSAITQLVGRWVNGRTCPRRAAPPPEPVPRRSSRLIYRED